ncbi:MAG: penicillin-binding transpeptidase domain-containing protein [Gammaproteobacteria bacterium]|nr:penicillin-binding transpeptidase domain-containing protein [Gammaproteobacteria bacterium]MDP2347826.1 penicillin-binding transpeptidase domain-containing protein [Gammaproteobacteria bacterium]
MCKVSLVTLLLLFALMSAANAQIAVTELPAARAVVDATGFEGAVLIYDLHNHAYMAGHAEHIDDIFLPASTFKIFSALAALEAGVIADKHSVIKWDGVVRGRTELNTDLDLQSAFRISAVPHFQHLVKSIGADRMQGFINSTGYGNRDISGGLDTFWLTGGLRISPRQQIAFLVRLYNGDLPFSDAAMSAVRDMMVVEKTPQYTIRAKTGWATLDTGENTGWWVGWVEKGPDVFMFASVLHANSPDDSFGAARLSVVRDVLDELDVLPQ